LDILKNFANEDLKWITKEEVMPFNCDVSFYSEGRHWSAARASASTFSRRA